MTTKKNSEKPMKLHNRFDEWQVLHFFTETTAEYLEKQYTSVDWKFYIKFVLGVLMAINGYLSHFGPWKWPANFYFLIFSVIFYYSASAIYNKLGDIKADDGRKVGEFIVDGVKLIYAFNLTPSKIEYILEEIQSETKISKRKKSFNYLEYFTEEGEFLQAKYLKHLQGFMSNVQK